MDYATYTTKREALAHIASMRGWDARPERLSLGESVGDQWVIRCNGHRYLRTDGFVR